MWRCVLFDGETVLVMDMGGIFAGCVEVGGEQDMYAGV